MNIKKNETYRNKLDHNLKVAITSVNEKAKSVYAVSNFDGKKRYYGEMFLDYWELCENLSFKKGTSKGCDKWTGSIAIDSELTLYYEIVEGRMYFETNVSNNPKISMSTGVYYECENLGETLDEAKKYIEDFVKLVKINPDNYKEN